MWSTVGSGQTCYAGAGIWSWPAAAWCDVYTDSTLHLVQLSYIQRFLSGLFLDVSILNVYLQLEFQASFKGIIICCLTAEMMRMYEAGVCWPGLPSVPMCGVMSAGAR